MSKADAVTKLIKLLEDHVRYDEWGDHYDDDYSTDVARETKREGEESIKQLKEDSMDDVAIEVFLTNLVVRYRLRARSAFLNDDEPMADYSRDLAGKLEEVLVELNPKITKKYIEAVVRDFRAREEYDSESYHDSPPDDDEDEDDDYDCDREEEMTE